MLTCSFCRSQSQLVCSFHRSQFDCSCSIILQLLFVYHSNNLHTTIPMANLTSSTASSSALTLSSNFEVFINHRGPDVKYTFASHLYRRLLERGLTVFLDKSEMEEGHNILSQMEEAIRGASVHVAILSPRYAEST